MHRPRSAAANNPPEDWRPFLGRKISIRYVLRGDPRHRFSEAVGVIQNVDPGDGDSGQYITVIRRTGVDLRINASDVVAVKFF